MNALEKITDSRTMIIFFQLTDNLNARIETADNETMMEIISEVKNISLVKKKNIDNKNSQSGCV